MKSLIAAGLILASGAAQAQETQEKQIEVLCGQPATMKAGMAASGLTQITTWDVKAGHVVHLFMSGKMPEGGLVAMLALRPDGKMCFIASGEWSVPQPKGDPS